MLALGRRYGLRQLDAIVNECDFTRIAGL